MFAKLRNKTQWVVAICACCVTCFLWQLNALRSSFTGKPPSQGFDHRSVSYPTSSPPKATAFEGIPSCSFELSSGEPHTHDIVAEQFSGAVIELKGDLTFDQRDDAPINVVVHVYELSRSISKGRVVGGGTAFCNVNLDDRVSGFQVPVQLPTTAGKYRYEMSFMHPQNLVAAKVVIVGSITVKQ